MSLTYSLRTPYVRHVRAENYFQSDKPTGCVVNFSPEVSNYLDEKLERLHASDCLTPWTKECNSTNNRSPLQNYKTLETLKIEHEIDQKTSAIITDLRVKKRPPFDNEQANNETIVLRRNTPGDFNEKSQKRIDLINERKLNELIQNDTRQIIKHLSSIQLDNDELPAEVERQVRSIYNKFTPKTKDSTCEGHTQEYISGEHDQRAKGRPECLSYMSVIDGRRAQKLYKQVDSSLQDSKRLLRKMDGRIECDFYKCSLNDRCWVCRKVVRNNANLRYYSSIRHHRL